MAYMNQARKAQRTPEIKAICKKYGIKATLAVNNGSTLVLNIKSGKIDFIENYNRVVGTKYPNDALKYPNDALKFRAQEGYLSVNPYWYQEHFDADALAFITEVIAAMYGDDYYDHSDAKVDYFDRSHYIDVNIGSYDKHYELTK